MPTPRTVTETLTSLMYFNIPGPPVRGVKIMGAYTSSHRRTEFNPNENEFHVAPIRKKHEKTTTFHTIVGYIR